MIISTLNQSGVYKRLKKKKICFNHSALLPMIYPLYIPNFNRQNNRVGLGCWCIECLPVIIVVFTLTGNGLTKYPVSYTILQVRGHLIYTPAIHTQFWDE